MIVHTVKALSDNFIFVVEANGEAMVVDPGQAAPVEKFLGEKNLDLTRILLTHCHNDHIGGVKELSDKHAVKILGPATLTKHGVQPDEILKESSQFQFHESSWSTMHLPGHTLDHLAYFEAQDRILFCGDVLFSLGCGRLFEGSFEQGYHSLARIKALPPETKIYCAHEYTLSNCNFHVKQNIAPVDAYENLKKSIEDRLARGENTVPTRLDFELKYNIFLKSDSLAQFVDYRTKKNG